MKYAKIYIKSVKTKLQSMAKKSPELKKTTPK